MGSGSTIAAASAVGYDAIGVELDEQYFRLAERAIPRLAELYPDFTGQTLLLNGDYGSGLPENDAQLALVLSQAPTRYRTAPAKRRKQPA